MTASEPRGEHDAEDAPGGEGEGHDTVPDPRTKPAAAPPAEAPPITVKLVRERRRRPVLEPEPREQEAPPAPTVGRAEALADTVGGAPESLPIAAPDRWDRYEILRLLGKGGMGAVYEARDRRLDRRVAIKFIHAATAVMTARFLREARAQARIDHPNVCKVLEVGEVEGKVYIAMELIEGSSLAHAARSMTIDEKVRLMKTVTEAVAAAHRLGIIHRDIKPGNILVQRTEGEAGGPSYRPVLMDFGLARESGDTHGLTESGAVMGTPAYMPPEQARGDIRKIDARSDIYSLGATLYDILSGGPPFGDESAVNILFKVLSQDPAPLRSKDPSLPQALETIAGKCLNKEPHHRYAAAEDLAADLDRFLGRERVLARRLSLPTRLYWRARRNRPMAAAIVALILSLTAFAGYGVRTVVVNARNEAVARRRAELGQKLGQAVKELEWLVRSAYLVPLHDTGPEKVAVRERMAQIEADMRAFGDLGAGLDHYALGRGHAALGEWGEAHEELARAEALGVSEPELSYALGRALGELYKRALDDARRSGDRSYFERRKGELDREYLEPALAHLERCRGLDSVPAPYLEGLIHFHHGRRDEALASARAAAEKIPWLYEAEALQGDVFMARALDEKDRGDGDGAERDFSHAVDHYGRAADIGRSDNQVHEALAEAWIRQEEMDLFRGRDPSSKLEQALSAADRALAAAPAESHGHTKKAFAYHFQARYAEGHGAPREEIERLRGAQIEAGKKAIAAHPLDAYAHEITGLAYTRLANDLLDRGKPVEPLLAQARAHLEEAIRRNPRFPWAHNDYGFALALTGIDRKRRNEDPRDAFEKAIVATKRAFELDDRYLVAYNNTSLWWTELAEWQSDHGASPEEALRDAVRMADRALEINGAYPPALGNAGLALERIAAHRLDAGEDGREPAREATARFRSLLAIDARDVLALIELSRAHLLLARHERARGVSPGSSLDEALRALARCRDVTPDNPDCKLVEAQVRAEAAERAPENDRPAAFEQARRLAAEAARKVPDRADMWLALATICLQESGARPGSAPAARPDPVVDEGLTAVARALERAPGSPRALATEGALSLRKAQADPSAAAEALRRARESFSRAFAANPLLRRLHGEAAAEVERRLAAP